jgi:hypothetical protein
MRRFDVGITAAQRRQIAASASGLTGAVSAAPAQAGATGIAALEKQTENQTVRKRLFLCD